MSVLPQASLFLGVIPALILLYISLKGYEGHYKDKNVFLAFVAGIIAGFLSVLLEGYTIGVRELFIVLFPILEQLFKTMTLNIGRLQGKREATIYGLSMGLGFGSIFTPFSMITYNFQMGDDSYAIALAVIGSFGIILMHAATGICLGYGVFSRKLSQYFILAIILHLPITGMSYVTALYRIEYLQVGLVVYGLIIYWYATKKIMPQILLQSKRRKRSKTS